jgi:hypothetical protein
MCNHRRRTRGRGNADIAAGAAAVLDDHRLAERLAKLRIDHARRNIGSAAGGKADDQRDLALGIVRADAIDRAHHDRE